MGKNKRVKKNLVSLILLLVCLVGLVSSYSVVPSQGNVALGTSPNERVGVGIIPGADSSAVGAKLEAFDMYRLVIAEIKGSNQYGAGFDLASYASGGERWRFLVSADGSRAGNLEFQTKMGSDETHMVISKDGNVGIGITNPNSELDVAGTIRTEEICDETGSNCLDVSSGWGGGSFSGDYNDLINKPTNLSEFNNDLGIGGNETDPTFIASPASGISSGDISNWDSAYDWVLNLSGEINSFVESQAIATNGATDWESFVIGTDTYLAVANYEDGSTFNINSKIYKWNGTEFEEFQSIPTQGASDWESFVIGSDMYLAVANYYNGSTRNIDSKIYKWNGTGFVEFQFIATNSARDWESFVIGNDTYLAVVNHYDGSTWNLNSKIYKWNGTGFEEFQSIQTVGAVDWEFFVIGTDRYLAVANHFSVSTWNLNSKIYKWNGTGFEEFQSIPTNGAEDWESFVIGNDTYLAVTNYNNGATTNIDSKIYKWNGTSFVEFQLIPTNAADDWDSFVIGTDTYLAVSNGYDGSTHNLDSKIYKWNGTEFEEFQLIGTNRALNWKSFVIGSDMYLAVANYYNGSSYNLNSKIYKWDSTGTEFLESDPTVPAEIKDGVNWSEILDIPADIFDGDNDTQLTEAEVDAFVGNNGYLTSESDPVFNSSPASGISSGDVSNWDSAYDWVLNLSGEINSFVESQAIATSGASSWESFVIGNDTYLAVSNGYDGVTKNINSKIYKWNGTGFEEFQSIATNSANDWESFKIGTDTYLAVANHDNDITVNINSKIYKWNGTLFEEFQLIATNGAVSWKSFMIGTDTYLAVANEYDGSTRNLYSKIYKWNGTAFEEFQSIFTNGAHDWESFFIGNDTYLAVANIKDAVTYNINSKIYKWNGTLFEEFQLIATNGAVDWESFVIGTDTYLAVANYEDGSTFNINSKIYKWNGTLFEEFQNILTSGANDWEFFVIGTDIYLSIANGRYGSSYNTNSKIYKWNGTLFEEFQSIATSGATDWEFFVIGTDMHLAISNGRDPSYNINSKIYKWDSTGTEFLESDPTVPAEIKDGINWSEILDIPADIFDGDDDTQLTEAEVDSFVSNNGYLTSYNETDPVWNSEKSNYILSSSTTNWDKDSSDDFSGDYNDLINEPNGLSEFTNDAGFIDNETDPVFTAWDKSSGISVTESQISDLQSYLTSESDPTVPSSIKDGINWSEVSDKPSGLDDGDDVGITNETDPVFTAWDKSSGISITESQISDLQSYLTSESDPTVPAGIKDGIDWSEVSDIPTGLDDGDNDTTLTEAEVDTFVSNNGYLTSYTETDPDFNSWDKSSGISITESQISDLQSYLTSESDPTVPAGIKDGIDWSEVSSIPADILDGDNDTQLTEAEVDTFVSNNGYLTSESDPLFSAWDKSTGIVITESQISDLQSYLTNETDPVWISEKSNYVLSSSTTNWDKDSSDDFSGDYNDLVNEPTGLSEFSNDVGFISNETDPDFNSWDKSLGISITESQISDLQSYLTSESDPTVPASVKDGTNWSEILDIPADIFDGDNDTQLTEAEVDAFVNNNGYLTSELDPTVPAGIKDGIDWSEVSSIPADIADGDDDTQLTEGEVDSYVDDNGYLTNESDPVWVSEKSGYYNKTDLDSGQLDSRYYTKTQVDSSLSQKVSKSGDSISGNLSVGGELRTGKICDETGGNCKNVSEGWGSGGNEWNSSGDDVYYDGGNVGVGVSDPARSLHISDAMRLEPVANPPRYASSGDMYFDDSEALCVFVDDIWSKVAGSGECISGSLKVYEKIIASDGEAGEHFGSSVSIDGDYAIVGSYEDDDRGSNSGSAYVYSYNGTNWIEKQKLFANDTEYGDGFGYASDIGGNYTIISALYEEYNGSNSGAAYIFKYNGTEWVEEQKLTASDRDISRTFGNTVFIKGDYVVIGDLGDDWNGGESGSVYIFKYNGTEWVEEQKLTASDGEADEYFGGSVSFNNDHIFIGAYGDNIDGSSNAGSVYIFKYNGTEWVEEQKLTASDGEADEYFGLSLSVEGNYAIIGSPEDNDKGTDSGSAYFFKYNGTEWVEEQKLTASDGAAGDKFGGYYDKSISMRGNYTIIGAWGKWYNGTNGVGAAYIFEYDGENWIQYSKLSAEDWAPNDQFGWAASIDDNYVIVSSWEDDINGSSNVGSAYIYELF